MSRGLRVGVVGCGIGRQHLDAYRSLPELFEVRAICDVDEQKAREAAARYGVDRAAGRRRRAAASGQHIDVVDLCTPPYLHAAQTLECLAAGKHVICEKPLCGSLEDADRLVAAERRSGRRVMPIFQYRFGHGIQKLRRLMERGSRVERTSRRSRRCGGGGRRTTRCPGARAGRPSWAARS